MNTMDDMFEENDFDEDIKLREQLIEEAKQLSEDEDLANTLRAANDLRRRWKRIAFWDSAYEESLREKFDTILDVFYVKQNELYKANATLKEELVKEAKALSQTTEFKNSSTKANELMKRWKAIGSAGREVDDTLWKAFNEAHGIFFEKKDEHWENLKDKFANAKSVKEEIIEKAKSLKDSDEWQKTGNIFHDLLEQWKAVGSAGRELEDDLWNQFNEHRQVFFSKREEYYASQREKQNENFEQKSALVTQAKQISEAQYYSRENTQTMKELGVKWKSIGSCGKNKEDEVWAQFRGYMDAYFDGLKQYNAQKQEMWRQGIIDARTRKLDLIQKQKRQIKHMQDEIVGLLGERAINEMEEEIKEKEQFIIELEEQVQELDAKINE